jgi:hypothetical protein
VRLASPIGSAAGGNVNLSTSLSNVAKLVAHPKFVWVFNANCDGTIIYNDPVLYTLNTSYTPPLYSEHRTKGRENFLELRLVPPGPAEEKYIGRANIYFAPPPSFTVTRE